MLVSCLRDLGKVPRSFLLAISMLVLLIFIGVADGSVHFPVSLEPNSTTTSPPVFLQGGTAGTSTIYANNTSAKTSARAPNYWYKSYWNYRKRITIDRTKVPNTDQLDFSVLINLASDAGLKAHARSDGFDILFTSSDGVTKLSYEREQYTSGTGALVAWVKVPTLSHTSDTVLYIYYGNSGATDQQDTAGTVWNSNFKGVWHLKENPASTAPQMRDSTNGTNHGTSSGSMTPSDQVTARIDGGLDFDGVNDVIDAGSNAPLDNQVPFTYSAWVYPRSMGGLSDARIVHKGSTTARKQLQIDSGGTNDLALYVDRSGGVAQAISVNNALVLNKWQYVGGTYSEADGPRVYINGTEVTYASRTVGSGATVSEVDYNFYIGNRPGADKGWDGLIDEVRVSNVIRSTDWIKTEYNNQNSPSTFYNVASEEQTTYDYVLRIANQVTDAWKIRLKTYSQSNIGRLNNCTIYFRNSTAGTSRQIYIQNGAYVTQTGPWYDLPASPAERYIAVTLNANDSQVSYVYVYLEILIPNKTTYARYIIAFEIT